MRLPDVLTSVRKSDPVRAAREGIELLSWGLGRVLSRKAIRAVLAALAIQGCASANSLQSGSATKGYEKEVKESIQPANMNPAEMEKTRPAAPKPGPKAKPAPSKDDLKTNEDIQDCLHRKKCFNV